MSYTRFQADWQTGSAGGTPITDAALDHIEAGIEAAHGEKVDRGGDTITGPVAINTTSATGTDPLGYTGALNTGLNIRSSATGGEDTADSTGRLNLYSFQRAGDHSFGENIRHFLMLGNAKSMDAWYAARQNGAMTSGYDGSGVPDGDAEWVPVAWTGAHWQANDGLSVHGHWSVEVPDSTGAVQTRFEVPFCDQEVVDGSKTLGVDVTNIRTNQADLTVRANLGALGTGVLRVGGGNSVSKDLLLSISADRATSGRRWIVRANADTESGSDAGTNFQIIRHSDTGTALGTGLGIRRSDGNIFAGTASALSARLGIVWGTSGHHGFYAAPSASPGAGAAFAGDMTATTDRVFQARLAADTVARYLVTADGKTEWGDGTATRDTNLYRTSADVLKTDDSMEIGANLRVRTTSVGGGTGVIGIANASVVPSINPTGGGVVYTEAGALKYRGSSGTVTTIAPA